MYKTNKNYTHANSRQSESGRVELCIEGGAVSRGVSGGVGVKSVIALVIIKGGHREQMTLTSKMLL